MSSVMFDSLPNEIVLAIIVRVHFSYESFQALLLTNRRISTLMSDRGRKLLEEIAGVQFPLALWASSQPTIPFDKNGPIYCLGRLDNLCSRSQKVDEFVHIVEKIRSDMLKEGDLGPALGARGWKQNLRVALHVMYFPSVPLEDHRGYGQRLKDRSHHYAMVLNDIPVDCILAVRHGTLMAVELFKFLDKLVAAKRAEMGLPATTTLAHNEIQLRRAIEFSFDKFQLSCRITFYALHGSGWSDPDKDIVDPWPLLKLTMGEVLLEPGSHSCASCRPNSRVSLTIQSCLNRRTQDVLGDWNNFVVQAPEAIAALQREGGEQNLKPVRALVERFLEQ
ncbi:hypothetical protein EPUS_00728 [Endocarpon pusillum Z07020]|uniref:Uncharacterized protein n=1 Tax=Endocarpon pusillum (strain Z07020 / HMAS-L-300199) TaxID=1263415 RepID=U1GQI4_ENDPU|nr:uncharacterized protein EPUS_00728 [Endocarpon pusillum Z07020]ERF74598.1 hypothetical protein EPUS_00728 [Endocarpon pusillum Z07020]